MRMMILTNIITSRNPVPEPMPVSIFFLYNYNLHPVCISITFISNFH